MYFSQKVFSILTCCVIFRQRLSFNVVPLLVKAVQARQRQQRWVYSSCLIYSDNLGKNKLLFCIANKLRSHCLSQVVYKFGTSC